MNFLCAFVLSLRLCVKTLLCGALLECIKCIKEASRIGLIHGLTNLGVMVLFIASWLLRRDSPGVPPTAAFALSFIGVAGALLGGWLGGELVERLGVGVTPGANLNAPSSLTHNARETKKRMTDAESY